jgi:hypothetical protein
MMGRKIRERSAATLLLLLAVSAAAEALPRRALRSESLLAAAIEQTLHFPNVRHLILVLLCLQAARFSKVMVNPIQ